MVIKWLNWCLVGCVIIHEGHLYSILHWMSFILHLILFGHPLDTFAFTSTLCHLKVWQWCLGSNIWQSGARQWYTIHKVSQWNSATNPLKIGSHRFLLALKEDWAMQHSKGYRSEGAFILIKLLEVPQNSWALGKACTVPLGSPLDEQWRIRNCLFHILLPSHV